MNDRFGITLPKAELHLHIEGTLEPELMVALAARNGIDLPLPSLDAVRRAYEFTNLQSFLDIYYRGTDVLRTAEDFSDLAAAYLRTAHAQGVRHVEMFFDPQTHTSRGVPMGAVVDGLTAAIAEAEASLGMSGALIMCFLRHLPAAHAMETLEAALPHADRIIGVGLDSSEVGYPPSMFAEVYRRAVAEGFVPVAHAGEEGPPQYVWEAIDVLGARRIDHGIRSMEDPTLVRRLAADGIPVTVCPLSNVRLQVVDELGEHPLPAMLDAGLNVSINSDDPAYFGGYIGDNYTAVGAELGLDGATLAEIARQSFRSSFLAQQRIDALIAEVDAAVDEGPATSDR
ncbi:MAG: adenosine deaminase [Actinomycetota bacterium]|nr:adenosine deaminase [Actinomycetota bacterium]